MKTVFFILSLSSLLFFAACRQRGHENADNGSTSGTAMEEGTGGGSATSTDTSGLVDSPSGIGSSDMGNKASETSSSDNSGNGSGSAQWKIN